MSHQEDFVLTVYWSFGGPYLSGDGLLLVLVFVEGQSESAAAVLQDHKKMKSSSKARIKKEPLESRDLREGGICSGEREKNVGRRN